VVEWGRGMVDGISDSVLDVEITRATGADASDTSESDDPDDVPDEPRRVVVSATGPRWADVSL